jgi:hypothetical protein
MLGLLRGNRLPSVVFLIIYTLLIWSPVLLDLGLSFDFSKKTFIVGTIQSGLPLFWLCLFIFFALLLGILLSRFASKIQLYRERTVLPMFIFATLLPLMNAQHLFNNAVFFGLLVLFCLKKIFKSYFSEKLAYQYLSIGILISLAGFISPQAFLLLPTTWFGLLLFRPFKWREWVYLWIGVALPLYFFFAYCYIIQSDVTAFNNLFIPLSSIEIHKISGMTADYVICAVLWFMCIAGTFYVNREPGLKIVLRRFYVLLAVLCTNIFLTMLLYPARFSYLAILMTIPCSLILSGILLRMKIRWLASGILWVLVILALFRHIYPLLF